MLRISTVPMILQRLARAVQQLWQCCSTGCCSAVRPPPPSSPPWATAGPGGSLTGLSQRTGRLTEVSSLPSLLAQLTRVILDETIDAFVPDDDEELLREPRKVKKDLEPRNFIKDKLCDLGLADVSMVM